MVWIGKGVAGLVRYHLLKQWSLDPTYSQLARKEDSVLHIPQTEATASR